MELSELTNHLWSKYKEGDFEDVFVETKKWFNNKSYVPYTTLIWLIAISNVSNKRIGAKIFWKYIIFGHRYDIFGNNFYKNIRKDFGERWEELIYAGHDDARSFWKVFYNELKWKKNYPKQKEVWLHLRAHKWEKYIDFIGDLEEAKFNENYHYLKFYIEDFEKDDDYISGRFTYQTSAPYFAKECLVYHIRNTLAQTINEFIGDLRIEHIKGKWVSEYNLYLEIKGYFKNYTVIHQGNPSFLGNQRFDIWIPELKVAIEYNGTQHYEPVEFFGGEEGLKATIMRDKLKRQKCLHNNIKLIEVVEGYELKKLIEEIGN